MFEPNVKAALAAGDVAGGPDVISVSGWKVGEYARSSMSNAPLVVSDKFWMRCCPRLSTRKIGVQPVWVGEIVALATSSPLQCCGPHACTTIGALPPCRTKSSTVVCGVGRLIVI